MNATIKPQSSNLRSHRHGFTLVEILVVIGIIVLLLSIAIPVISKVRNSARVAGVQAEISSLDGAIRQYQQDYNSLPGPLTYAEVSSPAALTHISIDPGAAGKGFAIAPFDTKKITMAENLVLGLAGGLRLDPAGAAPAPGAPPAMFYDPSLVGNGASSLNPANPKKARAYIDQTNLSWRDEAGKKSGQFKDGAGTADDSIIPEIVDTFPTPMPILYLRARKGQQSPTAVTAWSPIDNLIVTDGTTTLANRVGQYDLSQIVGYVGTPAAPVTIGEGKSIDAKSYTGTAPPPSQLRHGLMTVDVKGSMDKSAQAPLVYHYPYDAFPYFTDPSSNPTNPTPRNKDGFILISAGLDRVYGTADDITNFGAVNQ